MLRFYFKKEYLSIIASYMSTLGFLMPSKVETLVFFFSLQSRRLI